MTRSDSTRQSNDVEEWRIVPTIPSPDPDVDERYTAAPGPADGLTKSRARTLANERNKAGEPSPAINWRAEPTGDTKPAAELLD